MEEFYQLKAIDLANEDNVVSFGDLQRKYSGKVLVVDFWHTKCTRCPAALSKLNEEAEKLGSSCAVIACAISLGEGNLDTVRDVINEWENIHHIFIEQDVKEECKRIFGFSMLPFTVVLRKVGDSNTLLFSGDPKAMNLKELVAVASTSAAGNGGSLSFDEDF